jgi:DNA (cytosine-5)-methyltransferase 1
MLNMKILSKNNNEEIKKLCDELNDICEKQKKVRGRIIAENKKRTKEEKEDKEAMNSSSKNELDNLTKQRKEKEALLEDYKYSVVEDIEKIYNELGYNVYKKILTCSDYGCYTNRQRLFIVAVRKDLGIEWQYPEPTTKDCRPTVKDAFDIIDYSGLNNPIHDIDNRPMKHSPSTIEKFKKIQPGGKSEDSYFSRGTSSRLSLDKSAPTLVPGHSAFQIHPTEHRSITVREGATITGFHTNFKFYGSHSSRCMQIGNAIPVTMAYVIAEQCKKVLISNKKF